METAAVKGNPEVENGSAAKSDNWLIALWLVDQIAEEAFTEVRNVR